MTENEFDELLQTASERLKARQAALEARFGLSRMNRWLFDHHRGVLDFYSDDGSLQVSFETTPIGTFSSTQDTWKWAWANGHLDQALRDKSAAFKALAARTDYDLFADAEPVQADAGMAWELAALAVDHLGALGCYRAPNRETWLFLALERPLD